MKKLLFSVLFMAMVASMIGAGTWAYFSDYETSCDNYFGAGVLDLKVNDGDDPLPVLFNDTCIAPGWDQVDLLTVSNPGCVPGKLDITMLDLVDNENGCEEPEAEGCADPDNASCDPDTTCNATEGELSQYMRVEILADCDDESSTGPAGYETTVWANSTVLELFEQGNIRFCDCIWTEEGASEITEVPMMFHWWIDGPSVGNIIMGDSIEFCIEFSLEQEPCMGECVLEVTGFQQPASVIAGNPYIFSVDVHANGTTACDGWINVEVPETVWVDSTYVSGLAPCSSKKLPFSMPTAGLTPGSYTVVADGEVCPFEVLEPGALAVTGIQQDEYIQICEDLSVGIDIHNQGGVPTEGLVFACVVDPLGNPLTAPQFLATGMIDPCETVKVAVDFGHVGESWRPGGAVVAGFPANPIDPQEEELYICPMGFLLPATFEVTGIQQPAGLQPCEDIVIAVDVHNAGDKPGVCTVVSMWIENELGQTIYGPVEGTTGVLNPCDTEKVPFASVHADVTWLDTTIYVFSQACGGIPTMCPINVVGGPCIEVTGIQQPEEVMVCDELVVSVDVHNAGGKPGNCSVDVWVEDASQQIIAGPWNQPVPMLAPCDTEKIGPFVIGHVDESWVPGIVVWAESCCGDMVSCPIVVIPPPTCPVPEPCCWCIYLAEWWQGEPPYDPAPDFVEHFCLHTVEWLPEGHIENVGDPFPGAVLVIPPASFHQEFEGYAGPAPNGYGLPEWTRLLPPNAQGACRYNSILTLVYATGMGYWNSMADPITGTDCLVNWKTRFDVTTPLGPIVLYAGTLGVTPMVGNPGWPWAVGNAWASLGMSSITAPSTTYNEVVGMETITVPLFPGGIECYKVEGYSWDDTLGVEPGVPEPVELTLSATNWWHEDYGCSIKKVTVPGALYLGTENLSMEWYCFDPPFPPFQP